MDAQLKYCILIDITVYFDAICVRERLNELQIDSKEKVMRQSRAQIKILH